MGDWKLGALEATFGMGKPARIADVRAWIVDGDEAAFQRLSGRASKKLKEWYTLGLIGADPDDATMVERGLRLVRTVRSGRGGGRARPSSRRPGRRRSGRGCTTP